uniref:Uncharacterized protein n=1 Tax=Caulerpa verticillata TaxID=177082 RepID=A0A386B057_9CHLO|nr:hypothetical protein [Caulerpa verticillata]AYC65077.1 hypothetical protein [Caulerpa verticillata]
MFEFLAITSTLTGISLVSSVCIKFFTRRTSISTDELIRTHSVNPENQNLEHLTNINLPLSPRAREWKLQDEAYINEHLSLLLEEAETSFEEPQVQSALTREVLQNTQEFFRHRLMGEETRTFNRVFLGSVDYIGDMLPNHPSPEYEYSSSYVSEMFGYLFLSKSGIFTSEQIYNTNQYHLIQRLRVEESIHEILPQPNNLIQIIGYSRLTSDEIDEWNELYSDTEGVFRPGEVVDIISQPIPQIAQNQLVSELQNKLKNEIQLIEPAIQYPVYKRADFMVKISGFACGVTFILLLIATVSRIFGKQNSFSDEL